MAQVGVIGIGNMGLAMALRLQDRGHAVTVRDIDPAREALAAEAGCRVAGSPAAAAHGCEVLIVAVVDAPQVRAVLGGSDGAWATLGRGSTLLLCPTIAPGDVEAAAAEAAAHGVGVLDAPMSGGPLRAREGRMSLMVAGEDTAFDRCQGLLHDLADPVFRVGRRAGDGARTKLVNNLLAAINLAGATEAMALALRLGLDPATTLEVIERSSGQSWIGSDRLRRALAEDHRPAAHLALLAKDSRLALVEAHRAGLPVPTGEAAAGQFAAAAAAGLSREDDSALLRWLLTRPPGAPENAP